MSESAIMRNAGSYQAIAQEVSSSVDIPIQRAVSPLSLRQFSEFPRQPGSRTIAQHAAPSMASLGSVDHVQSHVRSATAVAMLQSHHLLQHTDPLQQLQELQEQYSPAAVHQAAPSHRPRLEKSPVSTPAGKAPKVRSSLAGSNGQKKKVPMNCQVRAWRLLLLA